MKKPLGLPLIAIAFGLLGLDGANAADKSETSKPNFVVIFCDDLGYGDLSCFGHPTIRTPRLDQMASQGQRWTQFYSAAPVCTPSRAALLTGRLPLRSGMCSDRRRVLFPNSKGGLPASEVTIAEMLKDAGYATACVGKWHLGHHKEFLPTNHGFDSYFGIPYSNDMDRAKSAPKGRTSIFEPQSEYFEVPILRDLEEIERPVDQTTLTRRYTQEATKFISEQSADEPFFLYLAHSMPHVPLFRSPDFENKSLRGLYGDVIAEIDWSVGQVLDSLEKAGVAENTLVVFTSDNGPWTSQLDHGGSAGLLHEGKGTTWEGGMREPTLMWWPGTIKPGAVTDLGSTMDLLATFAALSGANKPSGRVLDSFDLSGPITGQGTSPREHIFYYRGYQLMAVRHREFKVHYQQQGSYGTEPKKRTKCEPPKLYHLEVDPSERYNIAAENSEVIAKIDALVAEHRSTLKHAPSQLEH